METIPLSNTVTTTTTTAIGGGGINIRSYDPNIVIRAADDKLAMNDVVGGQTLFQSAILNWVDDAQFAARHTSGTGGGGYDSSSIGGGGGGDDHDQLREAIATLWIAYAQYLQKAKQNRSAIEAYEQAVCDPVVGHMGRIWLDYARFLVERNKLKKAQDVYLRALVGEENHTNDDTVDGGNNNVAAAGIDDSYGGAGRVTDEQDRNILWSEFLEMMQVNNPDLTMIKLREAIAKEHIVKRKPKTTMTAQPVPDGPSSSFGGGGDTTDDDDNMYDDLEPSSKRARVGDDDQAFTRIKLEPDIEPTESMNTMIADQDASTFNTAAGTVPRNHVVTPPDVKIEETALLDITENVVNDPQFMAIWMARDGDQPPQAPEPPLFAAAPPKLSDPTGKDLLGEDLALRLVERLLEPTGNVILQVCRGLWMLTGLKEERSHRKLQALDDGIKEGYHNLKHRLDERLSVSGAAEAAVRTMNETERRAYENDCNQRRQALLNKIAWEFRQLLWTQQQFLTKLKIPGFAGPTVDASEVEYQARVCSYLHSAFFLRQRIGDDAHMKMLQSQKVRLLKLQEEGITVAGASTYRTATPPPGGGSRRSRFSPMPTGIAVGNQQLPPTSRMSPHPAPPPQLYSTMMVGGQQQQQQYNMNPMQQQQQQYLPPPPPPPLPLLVHRQQPPLHPQGPTYIQQVQAQPSGIVGPSYGVGTIGGYPIPSTHPQQQQPQMMMMTMPPGYGVPQPLQPQQQQQQSQQQQQHPNLPYYHQ